jgi:hypothetical protein
VAIADTDDTGRYALAGLAPGDYTLIATGYPPVSSAVTVTAGTPTTHDLNLGHPHHGDHPHAGAP